jgi:hypothetical protein
MLGLSGQPRAGRLMEGFVGMGASVRERDLACNERPSSNMVLLHGMQPYHISLSIEDQRDVAVFSD